MTAIAEYALLDAAGVVLNVIVVDEDDPASLSVLESVIAAKDGPHGGVKSHARADLRKSGSGRPAPGTKLRGDGAWRTDVDHADLTGGKRREHRDGDEPGKPTGRLLDEHGGPKAGTALPTSGPPPAAKPTS